MAKNDQYVQFPLALLAYGASPTVRLNAILDFASRHAGQVKLKELQRLRLTFVPKRKVTGYNSKRALHQELLAGGEWIGVHYRDLSSSAASCQDLDQFLADFEAKHGRSPLVRLRTRFLFEARDQKGLRYEELCILAAIYSTVGNKRTPVRITQQMIQARALGYKSPKVLARALPDRTDQAKPLSSWGVRKLVLRLQARKLFARATYARRITYYSHRMDHPALVNAITHRKTRAGTVNFIRRQRDEAMTEKIRALLRQG